MYQILINPFQLDSITCVKRTTDGVVIPFSEDNTDYQAYLKWLSEGNTPLPAEEVTQ